MSFDRRLFLLAGLAAGCGFTPVYGPGGDAEALRGEIAFDPPRDDDGFELVRALEGRLGLPGSAPRYRLSAGITLSEVGQGITPDEEITRFSILGRVRFRLTDEVTGEIATSGEVDTFTSFSATGTPFATQSARRDARARLMASLADQIVARLLVTSGEWRV